MRSDIPTAVKDFAREIVPGADEAFNKPVKMIIGNHHWSLIGGDLEHMKSGIDLIIDGSWQLKDHKFTNPNDIANREFESRKYTTPCLVTMHISPEFESEYDESVLSK